MSEEQKKKLVTRREMLRLTGATGIGLLATACGGAAPTAQIIEVEKQVIVEKEVVRIETVEVERIVEKEVIKEIEVERIVEVQVEAEAAGPAMASVSGALWVLQGKDFHPDYNDYVRAEITAYAAEQGWPLDISYTAGFASGTGEIEKLAAAVQAGDPPDLVHQNYASVQLRNLYLVQPVTEVVEQIEAVYGPAASYVRQLHYLDDQWWAVPYHQRAGGGYYRRDQFDKVGIDVQAIRQFTDLREACLEANDVDNELYAWGMTPNRSGDGNTMINRPKTGWGAGWQDETGQFIATNSPEMIEAMTFIKETYTDDKWAAILPPGILAWNDISNNEAYLGSRISYTMNAGTVLAKAIVDNNPVAELTSYHKMCGGPVNQEFMSVDSKNFYVLRGSKNTDAAKQLILEFTANIDRMDGMLASAPAYSLPAYTDLWEISTYIQGSEVALQNKSAALDDSGINDVAWPGPISAALTALTESGIYNDMANAFLTGTPVADAVADAHDRMVLVFQEFDLPGEKS
jgi:multiple sugar transport system substrate-binding protein